MTAGGRGSAADVTASNVSSTARRRRRRRPSPRPARSPSGRVPSGRLSLAQPLDHQLHPSVVCVVNGPPRLRCGRPERAGLPPRQRLRHLAPRERRRRTRPIRAPWAAVRPSSRCHAISAGVTRRAEPFDESRSSRDSELPGRNARVVHRHSWNRGRSGPSATAATSQAATTTQRLLVPVPTQASTSTRARRRTSPPELGDQPFGSTSRSPCSSPPVRIPAARAPRAPCPRRRPARQLEDLARPTLVHVGPDEVVEEAPVRSLQRHDWAIE